MKNHHFLFYQSTDSSLIGNLSLYTKFNYVPTAIEYHTAIKNLEFTANVTRTRTSYFLEFFNILEIKLKN